LERLGCIIGDNASTNGTLCQTAGDFLSNDLIVDWDSASNQIRCIGHILNLIVQAFLFGKLDEDTMNSFERQEDAEVEEGELQLNIEAQQNLIRTEMSSLGKLHNIVVHIRGSALRTKEFQDKAGSRIPLDNRTRWNSWYKMLQVAIPLESSIDYYIKSQPDLKADTLKPKEWEILRTISNFLARFDAHTKQLESDHSNISDALPILFHVRY
jgi:hypothetical protein